MPMSLLSLSSVQPPPPPSSRRSALGGSVPPNCATSPADRQVPRPSLHTHLPPNHTHAPHSHLYFGYKLPALGVSLGLASMHTKDRVTLYIRTNHSINTRNPPTPTPLVKVYIRALVVHSSSPTKERSPVGREEAPHRLASR